MLGTIEKKKKTIEKHTRQKKLQTIPTNPDNQITKKANQDLWPPIKLTKTKKEEGEIEAFKKPKARRKKRARNN